MKSITQLVISLVALIASASAGIAGADYEAGRIAANHGDFVVALREWRPLAESGNPQAQYGLGRMYARGDGVKRDFRSAQKWFTAAAAGGEPRALFALGRMYELGDGVTADKQTARRLYERARAAGVPEAAERLRLLGPANGAAAQSNTAETPPNRPTAVSTAPVARNEPNAPAEKDESENTGIGIFALVVFAIMVKKVIATVRERVRAALLSRAGSLATAALTRGRSRDLATYEKPPAPPSAVSGEAAQLSSLPLPGDGPGWNPYGVLRVKPSASREEIERAFKRLIASDRPEHYAGMSDGVAKLAKREALQIRRAYAELSK